MGRKRKNAVYSYFSYDKTSKSSKCLVPGCETIVKGEHGTNLLYHLSTKHPSEYNIVNDRNKLNASEELSQTNDENDLNVSNTTDSPDKKTQKTGSSKFTYVQTQCVNLVTVHGRPFLLMDDQAFKNIIAMTPISPREAQSLNSHSIKRLIAERAEIVRENIIKDIKGRLVSLKIDSATRLDRTFFAVNVQYIENASVVIKTLGMAEMWDRSTSDYLREKLLYIIRKYKINLDQVYTITSDNGANMLKLTRSMNDILREEDISDDESDSDLEYSDQLLEVNFQSNDDVPYEITSVRCAAHSLQLAIQDALREDESLPTIEQARSVVRKLRTPTMKNIIKSSKKNKAILDNNTRWHSTFDMLERLKTLKNFCSEVPREELYCSLTFWDAIDDLLSSLRPAKICTKKLQAEQLTLSDFFHFWTKCYLDTSHVQTPLAQQICLFMKNRQNVLMTNATFLSALYLDPRFQVVLSSEEEALALHHLNITWLRILKIQANDINTNQEDENFSRPSTSSAADEQDEIELMLAQTEREKRCEQRARYIHTRADITNILQNFSNHKRLPLKENILSFWQKKALLEPQLYLLAKVVFAVPATQVSVERLFSSLKFVLNNLRYNLNENIVDDILVIRNNQ